MPNFHLQTASGRFGFREPAHLVPPGTELDLQALNNPFIAERCAKERQATASQIERSVSTGSGVSDIAHQLPDLSCYSRTSSSRIADHPLSRFDQNIDPSLRNPPISGNAGQNNEGMDNNEVELEAEDPSWEGYHDGREDNSSYKSSDSESDEEPDVHHQQAPTG